MRFAVGLFKLSYHQPRPYWVFPEVWPFKCSGYYGNPSGHCLLVMGLSLLLWLDLIYVSKLNTKFKVVILGIVLLFASTIAYSRIYLGVHSLN